MLVVVFLQTYASSALFSLQVCSPTFDVFEAAQEDSFFGQCLSEGRSIGVLLKMTRAEGNAL